jgi:hypothetical protein
MSKTRSVQPRTTESPQRLVPTSGRLLDRILDTPHVAEVVPRLAPGVLHRVIQRCGLEDCGDLVALATPGQLARVFDADLWRPARGGFDEQLDPDRFGVWLEVLVESGPALAAQKLAGIGSEIVIAGLASHVLVFDRAAVSPISGGGEDVPEVRPSSDGTACEIGSYLVEARRSDAWDAIVALLLFLDADHPDYFHELMQGCRRLSSSGYEIDGLDDLLGVGEQDMFDLAVDRERRRDAEGYVSPAQARAFLQSARQLESAGQAPPAADAIVRAYFRSLDAPPPGAEAKRALTAPPDATAPPDETAAAVVAMMDVLVDAGVLPQPPRALIAAPQEHAKRLGLLEAYMRGALEADEAAFSRRTQEFAFLGNAITAGCSIQARAFTPREASDAAAAICNLGLQNWPSAWGRDEMLPDDFLVSHDLIAVFAVGWTVLHDQVGMAVATRLTDILHGFRSQDREIQLAVEDLRSRLVRGCRAGTPWSARDALDVIMMLDMPAWAALVALLDECPVIHAAMNANASRLRTIDASSFEFIAENEQIAAVHAFMQSLPGVLREPSEGEGGESVAAARRPI